MTSVGNGEEAKSELLVSCNLQESRWSEPSFHEETERSSDDNDRSRMSLYCGKCAPEDAGCDGFFWKRKVERVVPCLSIEKA